VNEERLLKSVYQRLLWIALLTAACVVTLGAYVRLSDAGLGCPDWPGCYGKLVGVPEHDHEIDAAQEAYPHAPVEAPKAWKEMIHRYLAGGLGLMILGVAVAAWRERRPLFWPFALVLLVAFQAALGMWTVTLLLKPVIVTLHLLGGLTTLGILFGLWWLQRPQSSHVPNLPSAAQFTRAAWLVLALVIVQISLGGWTSTNYAAMACPDYPMCQGQWLPDMDWQHAFTINRELGQTASGDGLPLASLVAIHWLHRWLAIVVVAALVWLGWRLMRAGWRANGMALMHVVALQWLIGVSNVWLQWPLSLAVLHNTGAALVLLTVLATLMRVREAAKRP
jgi:cytochrome c oxidase assembly protein subunit 15